MTEFNEPEDIQLVASWRDGDLSAFETVVRRYQAKLFNISLRILGNYEDAGEVVQDSFLAAHRGIGSFRHESRLFTWLTSITINTARNRATKNRSRQHLEISGHPQPHGECEEIPEREPTSTAPSALEQLERHELHLKLRSCIEQLGADFREVLVLRDVENMAYEEVCSALGIRPGTLKSRLFRAREMIKVCLKRSLGEFL